MCVMLRQSRLFREVPQRAPPTHTHIKGKQSEKCWGIFLFVLGLALPSLLQYKMKVKLDWTVYTTSSKQLSGDSSYLQPLTQMKLLPSYGQSYGTEIKAMTISTGMLRREQPDRT